MTLWDKVRQMHRSDGLPRRRWGNVICTSREFGSGSSVLSRGLSERLGFEVYDRKIVELIRNNSELRDPILGSVDEQTRGWFKDLIGDLFLGGSNARWRYEQELAELLLALAHHGNVIIVGRGANFLLPREHTLALRLIAPLEWRARRVAQLNDLDEARAQTLTLDGEEARKSFIRKSFGQEASDPHHYDLVLNAGTLSPETLVHTALAAWHGKFPEQRHWHEGLPVDPETVLAGPGTD
jgi:cytidylate kinase